MRVDLAVVNRALGPDGRRFRPPRRAVLQRALDAAAGLMGTASSGRRRGPDQAGTRTALGVAWVADREMRELNTRFAGRRGATDVLAFEGDGPEHGSGAASLGEVVVNLELARGAARQGGNGPEAEAVLYAVHGLLHLLGGTDETREGRLRMRRVETKALAAAGLRVGGGEWERRPPARRGGRRTGQG